MCTVVEPLYIDHHGKAVCFGSIGMSIYLLPRFYDRVAVTFDGGALRGKRNMIKSWWDPDLLMQISCLKKNYTAVIPKNCK